MINARSYYVSHLLSSQNGQSTAEDGVTPAVKVLHMASLEHILRYVHARKNVTQHLFVPPGEGKCSWNGENGSFWAISKAEKAHIYDCVTVTVWLI